MTVLEYKGYLGSAEVDIEDEIIFGKVLFIRDAIVYHALAPKDIEPAFRAAIDRYLEDCAAVGKEPDVPFKGSFNVRTGPDRHRRAALAARARDVSLNEYVNAAIDATLNPAPTVHEHYIVHMHTDEFTTVSSAASGPQLWQGTTHGRC